jgi:hypothetical protein
VLFPEPRPTETYAKSFLDYLGPQAGIIMDDLDFMKTFKGLRQDGDAVLGATESAAA